MNTRRLLCILALAFPGLPVVAHAEKTVARKDLPAVVEKTVARETEGATLKGLSTEPCEGGVKGLCYEVETMRGGRSRDIIVDATGAVIEVEEGMALAELPAPVATAAAKLGKVLRAEKVTRGGQTTFELLVEKAGRKSEHAFSADGAPAK